MTRLQLLGLWLLSVPLVLVLLIIQLVQALRGNKRAYRIFCAFDGGLNAAFGRLEDVMLSTTAGLSRREGKPLWAWLANTLDAIDENHCEKSINNDRAEAEKVMELLK